MKCKYPRISNLLVYERIDECTFEVTELFYGSSHICGIYVVDFMKQLDGMTDPYEIDTCLSREEIDDTLHYIEENRLTRSKRILSAEGSKYLTVWIPKNSARMQPLAKVLNLILMAICLPALILGVILFYKASNYGGADYYLLGFPLGVLSGVIVHELGHAIAGLAYGREVLEFGIDFSGFSFPHGYVILNKLIADKPLREAQISLSGIEMNLLFAGVFLFLGSVFHPLAEIFLMAGALNFLLALFNLFPSRGVDGAKVFSGLLGVEDFMYGVRNLAFRKEWRKKTLSRGPIGYAVFFVCGVLLVLQFVFPVMSFFFVLESFLCLI